MCVLFLHFIINKCYCCRSSYCYCCCCYCCCCCSYPQFFPLSELCSVCCLPLAKTQTRSPRMYVAAAHEQSKKGCTRYNCPVPDHIQISSERSLLSNPQTIRWDWPQIGYRALLSSSSAAPDSALFEPDRQLAMHAQPKLLLILSIVRHERVLSLRLLNTADLMTQIHNSVI